MSVSLQELISDLEVYTDNYDTGTITSDIKIRHINRAIEWVKRKIAFPSDERIQEIRFCQDQLYYDLDSDVNELLYAKYKTDADNDANPWENRPYQEIHRRIGRGDKRNWFGETHIKGAKQVAIWGYNKLGGATLFNLDDDEGWTLLNDASGLAVDTLQKQEGSASLSFDITNSAGTASIENLDVDLDIKALIEREGFIKLYTYLTDNDIDDITLWLYDDASNYYTITTTEDDSGDAFAENEWIKIGFDFEDLVTVGTPDPEEITRIRVEYDLGSGFVSATDFRIDHIFTCFPDTLELIYLSSIKGTNSSGATNKTILDDLTDLADLGHDDCRELVARRASLTLYPSLRANPEWYGEYVRQMKETLGDFARRWPRKRTANSSETRFVR
jgi:hypothetical protein